MAPLPKKKYPKSRQGKRRSHLHAEASKVVSCPQCHSPKQPHRVCPTCGTYNGREVVAVKAAKKPSS